MHTQKFLYQNHRGEVSVRRVEPLSWCYGTTTHYPETQLILEAFDLDKQAKRSFAFEYILEFYPQTEPETEDTEIEEAETIKAPTK